MKPVRDQVPNQVNIDAWNIYRKQLDFYKAEVLVEFQVEGRVINQIDTNVKERVRNKIQ